MAKDQILSEPLIKEVILDAPLPRVWEALTDRDQLKEWCFDMNAFKAEEGFEFQFYGEKDGYKFLHLCKVVEVQAQKRMKWLWTYKDMPGDTYVTFELFSEGDQTRLRLTHEGLQNLPQDENYARGNFVEGWNYILGKSLPEFLSAK